MELGSILKVITRNLSIIGTSLLVSFLVSNHLIAKQTPTYQVRQDITINFTKATPNEVFSYANYYGEFSSNHLTSTILGWFRSGPFLDNITKGMPNTSAIATKMERSNFIITSTAKKKEVANEVADNAVNHLQEKITEYNTSSNNQYNLLVGTKTYTKNNTNPKLILLIGCISFGILGVLIAYLQEILRGKIILTSTVEELIGKTATEQLPRNIKASDENYILSKFQSEDIALFYVGFKEIPDLQINKVGQAIQVNDNFQEVKTLKRRTNILFIKKGKATILQTKRIIDILGKETTEIITVN